MLHGAVRILISCIFAIAYCANQVYPDDFCSGVKPPENGRVEAEGNPPYKIGTVLRFTCNGGYHLAPKSRESSTCVEGGIWSNTPPRCFGIACERDERKIDKNRACRKSCESNEDCKSQNKLCLCDGLCGKSCFNPDLKCDEHLPHPLHGRVVGSGRKYGDIVTYDCDNGYTINGHRRRICRSDNQWSGDDPQCVPYATCGQAGDTGDEAFGLVVGGKDSLPGAWPWQAVILEARRQELANMQYSNRVRGGGSVINNEWILSAAHVFNETHRTLEKENVLIVLGATKLPPSGSLFPEHVHIYQVEQIHQSHRYDMDSLDFDLALIRIGNRVIKLGQRYVLSSSGGTIEYTEKVRPVCLPCLSNNGYEFDAKGCKRWKDLLRQQTKKGKNHGIVTGFGYMNSPDGLQIPDNLQQGWVEILTDDICARYVGENKPKPKYLKIKYTEQMACAIGSHKSIRTDACDGDSGGPLVRQFTRDNRESYFQIGIVSWGLQCGEMGFYTSVTSVMSWISEKIQNVAAPAVVTCESLQPPKNGNILEESTSTVRFSCAEGYELEGTEISYCLANLQWSSQPPLCRAPECHGIISPPGGIVQASSGPPYTDGVTLKYSCNFGYKLVGKNKSTCNRGSWSEKSPTCDEIACKARRLQNGISTPEKSFHQVENSVTFLCNDGYELQGKEQSMCKLGGSWSGTLPVCKEIQCMSRPLLNGVVIQAKRYYRAGSSVKFSCNDWFKLEGKNVSLCLSDGSWSSPTPNCRVCGVKGRGRSLIGQTILRTQTAAEFEWPWVVLITYGPHILSRTTCEGSLISPRHVLLPAHCASQEGMQRGLHIWLGVADRTKNSSFAKRVTTEKIFVHPGYDVDSLFDKDVAVIQLSETISMGDSYRPVCLPSTEEEFNLTNAGGEGIVVGWPLEWPFLSSASRLQALSLTVATHAECWTSFQNFSSSEEPQPRLRLTKNMLCIRPSLFGNFEIPCWSGPFFTRNPNSGIHVQIGLASFGIRCSPRMEIAYKVFTKLNNEIVQWIRNVTNNLA